jgi:hypothetical protein
MIFIYYYNYLQSRQEADAADDKLMSEPSLYNNIQTWAGEMISGSTTSGRVLVCFSFLCNMVAIVIYIKGIIKNKLLKCHERHIILVIRPLYLNKNVL